MGGNEDELSGRDVAEALRWLEALVHLASIHARGEEAAAVVVDVVPLRWSSVEGRLKQGHKIMVSHTQVTHQRRLVKLHAQEIACKLMAQSCRLLSRQ